MTLAAILMRSAPLALLIAIAACGDDGPAAPTDVTADLAPDGGGGLGVDYAPRPGGPAPRFEPDVADFTAVPWPTDRVLLETGRLGLDRFPNPEETDLIVQYAEYGELALDGWGRNGTAYVQLDRPIDPASLPDPETSMQDPRAAVQWIRMDDGPTPGAARLPLVFRMVDDPTDPYYLGPTLAIRPVFGFPLADGGTYCVIVTRLVTDPEGRYLQQPAAFAEALGNESSLAPLRSWLPGSELAAEDIAVATCFTAQDATRELREVADFLATRPVSGLTDIAYTGQTTHFHGFTAKYRSPNFQSGEKPYQGEGGDIQFGQDGLPIVAEEEELRVQILVPRNATQPEGGWPVVLYGHGTGGDWQTCLDGAEAEVPRDGLAMLCIDQPLHGPRGTGGEVDILQVFNFLNPASGRTSFRQSAIDVLWQSRMVAEGAFDIPGSATRFGRDVAFDAERILFFGHSHGGLAGAIVMAVDPRIRGAVLSGSSGVLIETILRRKDPIDIRGVIAVVAGLQAEQLDTFHPVVNLAQMLVDATDPVNYAPYWLNPLGDGRAKDVLMTSGAVDDASPAVGADAVAAAAGVPLILPIDHESEAHTLLGLAPLPTPLSDNLRAGNGAVVTGGLRQYTGGDHFVALTLREAIDLWRGFFRAYAAGGSPIIGQ